MYLGQRVIDNATDISVKVNDWRTLTHTFAYTAGNYLYVGSEVPFTNLYFDVGTANDVAATCTAQIWFAQTWHATVDLIDETASVSGASLAQSGRITLTPAFNSGWDNAYRTNQVTGLTTFDIFDMFWMRFSWSQTLKATTTLKYIGQKFAEDGDLYVFYPDLNSSALKQAYDPAKTTWDDQHFAAAEYICKQLIAKQIMWARGQIVDPRRLQEAAVHKAAQLIYGSFGKGYQENMDQASRRYADAINMGNFAVDRNMTGKVTPDTKMFSQKFLSR